jgi:exopolyphosphatase/guanosine-5'-triphosphate,3'-diphosphate pyrophosphatase
MKHDPPATDEIDTATRFIDQVLPPLPRGLPLVGIAGTVTTLGAMHAGIDPYDPERVHGMELSREAVAAQINRLRDLPLAGRKRLPGLSPERADVILAGALILLRVMDRLEAPTVRISDRGIRWGLLYEQMGSRGSPAP